MTAAVDTRGVHGAANKVDRITVADMKDKLLSLDTLRERLATTEPISHVGFDTGEGVRFEVKPAWNHAIETKAGDDVVDATVKIGRGGSAQEFQLTKDALLEATSLCGLPKGYVTRTPSKLIEPQLNYWFREGLGTKSFKLMSVGDNRGAAFARGTIQPFSNLQLLDKALEGIRSKYGADAEVLADYKMQHSLQNTAFRLIVPENTRVIERTGTDDDSWSIGLQVKNSLIGLDQTQIDGYLFRWWCTNGSIDTAASSGAWSRRGGGQSEEVYEWARHSVDEVLGGLEHSLDKVQAMVDEPVAGEAADLLRDIFAQYKVPGPLRRNIIDNMVDADQLNMYAIMQAITQVANLPEIDFGHAEQLMTVGGDLPNKAHARCGECHRITV